MNPNAGNVDIKTCLYCARWKPEGKIRKVIRHGGYCKLTGDDTRPAASCWGWKEMSPAQLDDRISNGLIKG